MPLPLTMKDFKNEIKKCIIKTLPKILKGGSTSKKIFCVVVAHKTEKINGKDLDELVCNSFEEFLQGEKDKNKYARIKCPRVFVFSKTEAALFLGFSRTIPSINQYQLQNFYFPLDELQLFGEDFENQQENNMIPASFNYQQWTGDTKCQYEKKAKEDIFQHFVEVYQSNKTNYYGFTNKKGDNIVFLPSSADESKLQEINQDNVVDIIVTILTSHTYSRFFSSFADSLEGIQYNENYALHFTAFDDMIENIINKNSWKGAPKLNDIFSYFYGLKKTEYKIDLDDDSQKINFLETMKSALQFTSKITISNIYNYLKKQFSQAPRYTNVFKFEVMKRIPNKDVIFYIMEFPRLILGFSDDQSQSYDLCMWTADTSKTLKNKPQKTMPNNYLNRTPDLEGNSFNPEDNQAQNNEDPDLFLNDDSIDIDEDNPF